MSQINKKQGKTMSVPETIPEVAKKVLFAIRQGVYSPDFTKSLISYVSSEKSYEVEYYVSATGEYEQTTMKLYVEKMEKGSVIVLVSPETGFSPESIEKLVTLTTPDTAYGVAVPMGVNNFKGTKLVQTMEHARIMTATFELSAKSGVVELDKDAAVTVSNFQRNDIICVSYETIQMGVDISLGYTKLCEQVTCKLLTQFPSSYRGVNGCLLEQLRHIVYMRGMSV